MFYLINKEKWMTSFQVIRELRKKLNIKKMWHIGTLDPEANGLMLIATEQSTKLLSLINNNKKSYTFSVHLDGKTESLDLETPIEKIDTKNLYIPPACELEKKLLQTTEQIPPKFSAIHINGQRAYKLARKNRDFEIPKRKITVYDASVKCDEKFSLLVEITISSGGYIRSFAPLIAEWCGVDGGYISLLQRDKLFFGENFLSLKHSQTLENFDKKNTIPLDILLPEIPYFFIKSEKILPDIKNGVIPADTNFEHILAKTQIWEKFFINFWKKYTSLFENNSWQIRIIRNDIESFL